MKITKTIYLALLAVLLSPMALADPIDYNCSDCPFGIGPDPETVSSTITINDSGTISELNVFIEAVHTYAGDLIVSLSNGSISVELFNGGGLGNSANWGGGSFLSLAAFVGSELQGDWTLTVEDIFFIDSGTVFGWGLGGTYDPTPSNSVPEPGTLALLGLGLVGMAARRRKTV